MNVFDFSIDNIAQLIYIITPLLLSTFFIMLTIINGDAKGLIYMSGAILFIICYISICNVLKLDCNPNATSNVCNTFGLPLSSTVGRYTSSTSMFYIMFTLIYIILPMATRNRYNVQFIIIMVLLLLVNVYGTFRYSCSTILQFFISIILGGGSGVLWYYIISLINGGSYLYYNEISSNSVQCKKPSEQTFKCLVYQNGQKISEIS